MTIGVDVLVRLLDKLSGPLRDTEGAVAKAAERMQKRLQFSMHLSGAADAASRVASGATNMIAGFTNSIRDVERAKGELTEQMTLLGMMQQQMQAGEAGTALRAFATNAARAHEEFGKMQVTADRPVRVRVLDENGQLRAMPDILADLRQRYGETLDAFEAAEIQKAFGTEEAMKLINALYGQEEAVRANAEALDAAAQKGNAFTSEMARAADNNWDAKAVLMAQKFDALKQKIGEALLPVVERLVPAIDKFITRAGAWIDANPELVSGIGLVVAAVAAAATVLTPLLLGLSALVSGFAMASYAVTAFSVLASPIGLIVAGIAAAAYLIYRYWEPIKGFFSALWARVKAAFSWAWEGIKGLLLSYTPAGLIYQHWDKIIAWFSNLWGRVRSGSSDGWSEIKAMLAQYGPQIVIYEAWDKTVAWFAGLWGRVKGAFSAGWEGIRAEVAQWPARMLDYGAALIDALIEGIRSKIAALGEIVSAAMAKLNPFSKAQVNVDMAVTARQSAETPGQSGLSADKQAGAVAKQRERLDRLGVPPVQARASGGAFGPGPLLTGEEGAELMYASEGGYIAHNRALRGMMDMAARTSRMMRGIGGGIGGAVAPMAALASVAGAGAVATPRPLTFAPQYSIPLTINGGSSTDASAIVAVVRRELMAAEERARVEARRLIHD